MTRKTTIVLAVVAAMTSPAFADTMLTLTPDFFLNVSLDGDRNSVGTVDAGALGSSTYIARERQTLTQETLRIASFIDFDLSSLTPTQVNDAVFSAVFQLEFDTRLNTLNNMAVGLGRVDDDGTNGDVWDDSLAAGTVPLFEWGMSSADQQTILPNVRTDTLGTTFSVDVTPILQNWVNGVNADNGFVLFGETAVFQGAGFVDAELQLNLPDAPEMTIVPEPASIAVWSIIGLVLCGSLCRTRRVANPAR